jgi:rhamnosyltransferase
VISVVIPVLNGGADLRRCLAAIAQQEISAPVEIVVVDSGSTDGSVDAAQGLGATVVELPPGGFTHGGSRNAGCRASRGEVLVFTSQDAYADGPHWLAALVSPLAAGSSIAGTYGRQVAHEGATPPEQYFLGFLYGTEPRIQRASAADELSMETTLFSNVNSAIPRRIWEAFPFVEDIIMSEDQEWSVRVLLAGHAVAYVPTAVVRHSHRYTIATAFKRFFDSGVSGERTYLAADAPAAGVLRRQAVAYARGELDWLWRHHRLWLPYAIAYEGAKFAGLQLGRRHSLLPHWLKRRLSSHDRYWEGVVGR